MIVHLSIIGIILATISAMVIGMIWYSPAVFGKSWMKMIGLTNKQMSKVGPKAMTVMVFVSLITAYVLSFFIAYTQNFLQCSWFEAGIVTSLFAWVGFCVTTIFAHGILEPRDKKILYINVGNRLATLLAMGMIIGAIMK